MSVTVSLASPHTATGLTSQRKLGGPFRVAAWAQALALLLISGCSASSHGERLFWSAQRLNAPIAEDPGRATPEQFADAIAAFDRVIRAAPGTEWAVRAHLAVGSLHALQGHDERAGDAFGAALRDCSRWQDLCLTARVAIAKLAAWGCPSGPPGPPSASGASTRLEHLGMQFVAQHPAASPPATPSTN